MSSSVTFDPYTTPYLPTPPGETSYLGRTPPSREPELLAVIIISFVITIPITLARVFTKLHIRREFKAEDYAIVAAQVAFIGFCSCYLAAPVKGVHGWDLSIAEVVEFGYWSYTRFLVYVVTVLLAKNGILLQLERVFSIVRYDAVWWTVRVVVWVSTIFYAIGFFLQMFACTPREKIWNPSVPGTCLPVAGMSLPFGIFNILSNLAILVLPLPVIGNLKASLRKRVMLGCVFGVVVFALIASIIRTIFFMQYEASVDKTYTFVSYVIWALIEIASIIFASSFPIMPRFIHYLRGEPQTNAGTSPTPRLAIAVPEFTIDEKSSGPTTDPITPLETPISPLRAFFRRSTSRSQPESPLEGFAAAAFWGPSPKAERNGALGPALTPRGQRRKVRNWYDATEVMGTNIGEEEREGDEEQGETEDMKKGAEVEVKELRRSSISSDPDSDAEKGFRIEQAVKRKA